MNRVPIDNEPTNLTPCFNLRSRREYNSFDTVNTRLVEHWQTDSPAMQYSRRDVSGTIFWLDMNPTASRLYRENLMQNQPFVVPAANSEEVRKTVALQDQVNQTLSSIQGFGTQLTRAQGAVQTSTIRGQLVEKQDSYQLLLTRQRQIQIDTLSDNPYFDKYDIASDSRNIVREMRTVVSEDIVDRGVRESQLLLQRGLDNRFLPRGFAADRGIDQLSAFELMRPRFTNMEKNYR